MKSRCLTFLITTIVAASAFTGLAAAQNPVPLINEPLVPDATKPGGAGFTLTVNGTGFVSGSVVKWNGSARSTTFVSTSKLTASIAALDIATAKTASVTVVNPKPGGGTSNVAFFGVTQPTSSLVLAALSYGTADRSYGVAVGDFNNDGKLDLAVANFNRKSISVLLGNGDGTFQAHVEYATGSEPQSVAVGDFNGDGKLDLAVANFFDNTISVLLGNGDGTFQAHVEYATGNWPASVAVGDFNRDGKLDLVVANSVDNNISVFLGNGDGTFQHAMNYGVEGGALALGDFNRDGKLDLAVGGSSFVSVLLGNGDGSFQPGVSYNTGPNPTSVAVADFNGDGKLDLVVATNGLSNNNTVSILLGNGDGTFQAHVDYPTGSNNPASVAVGDFNGDGKLDLVVADLFSTDVRLLLGNGDGTFGTAASYAAGSEPSSVVVGDFNGDGRLDMAVADSDSATVSVLLEATTDSLSKTSLTFGSQAVGTISAPQTVTLTNTGAFKLTGSIAVTGTNASDFSQHNRCGGGLPPGGVCTITATFAPTDRGPRTASVTITDNTAGSPQSIALTGTGYFSGPNATLSATSLTYSTQLVGTTSAAQSVTLTNYGTAALSITSINLTGTDPADFAQSTTCGSSLAPGASCVISVTFTPMQGGKRVAALSITDNAPFSPQKVSLSGIGTAVELSPASLSFGVHPVGSSSTQTTTLTNAGSTALNITGIVVTADTDEFHQTNTCGTGVKAGKSCVITVTFTPKERGSDGAAVSISDNDITSPQQVPLSGAGCVYQIVKGHRKCVTTISTAVQATLAGSRSTAVPSVTGADRVGTRVLDLVDSSRIDPSATNGLNRELLVRVWYPASAEPACMLADYTSPRVWNYFAELTRLPVPAVATNSCLNAPVADGQHPVVVFTHGYTGTFTDYTFLVEDLASRGYIVVSIDHTYEATAVEFPDERFVKSRVGSHLTNTWQTDDQSLSSALDVRLDDVKFVTEELARLNTSSGNAFAGKLDLARLALAGHSLGGLTAWFGAQRDQRFKAAVLLDPYLPDIPFGSTETPVMLFTMGGEQRNEDECQVWSDLRGPRLAVSLRGAEHVTPSDLVWLAKGAVKTGPMGPDKTVKALRDYIAAFLGTNLQGKPVDPLLTGPSAEFPDAAVTTQKQSLCGEAAAH